MEPGLADGGGRWADRCSRCGERSCQLALHCARERMASSQHSTQGFASLHVQKQKSNRNANGRAEPEPLCPTTTGPASAFQTPPPTQLSRTGRIGVLGLPAASTAAGAGLMQRQAERPAGHAEDRSDGCKDSAGPTRPQAHLSSSWHSLSSMALSSLSSARPAHIRALSRTLALHA